MTLAVASADPTAPPLHLVDEINHRVVNEYTEAISSLSLAAAATASLQAKAALRDAAERLHAHAEAHRSLAPPRGEGLADLAVHVARIGAAACKASLAERGVRLVVRAEEVWLEAERCWRAGLILSELIRNAARHGLSGKTGVIYVSVSERCGQVSCVVCDDGGTLPAPSPGRGCRLVEALATDLSGSVDWRFTALGTVVALRFPSMTAAA